MRFNHLIGACAVLSALPLGNAWAAPPSPRITGSKIYQKLAGVPPTLEQLNRLEQMVKNGDLTGAAMLGMENKAFYSGTVKYMVSPMSNVSQQSNVDLNDFTATVIGMIRDDVPLNQMVYEDILYKGEESVLNAAPNNYGISTYADDTNTHYRDLDLKGVDLSNPAFLVRRRQSQVNRISPENTMGVMTTRSAGEAFYKDGTGRRPLRFSMINFFCRDMEKLHDNTVADYRVRQDVPRNAGGDSSTFVTQCSGCHAGMDALAGAFARLDFRPSRDGDNNFSRARIWESVPPSVWTKAIRNSNMYPEGYLTVDDSWVNLWSEGQNAVLGWRDPAGGSASSGIGPKSLGMVIGSAKAFSECFAKRVYSHVCSRKAPFSAGEEAAFRALANTFESSNYNGKRLFAESVQFCVGE